MGGIFNNNQPSTKNIHLVTKSISQTSFWGTNKYGQKCVFTITVYVKVDWLSFCPTEHNTKRKNKKGLYCTHIRLSLYRSGTGSYILVSTYGTGTSTYMIQESRPEMPVLSENLHDHRDERRLARQPEGLQELSQCLVNSANISKTGYWLLS